MPTYTSYTAIGQAEDVSDVITTITPTKTPFQAAIGSETTDATLFEWQEDSLAAPADKATVEGADAPDTTVAVTVMRNNRVQLMMDAFKISGTNERVKKYGRKSERAYQLVKLGKQMRRHLEHTLVGLNQAQAAGDASSNARRTASAWQMIATSTTDSNSGTGRAFSETILLSVLRKVYDTGGDVSIMQIKPGDATIASGFAAASGRNREISDKRIVNAVDLYVSPFGEVRFVLNRFQIVSRALAYDPDNWKLVWLRKWQTELLAKTGDSEKHMLLGEVGLKHVNQEASGAAIDLN